MARPEAKIDPAELEKLCAMQCTDEEIAAFFGVSTRTVERRRKIQRFSDVMEQARAKGRVSVRRNLFRLASNGNVAAAIFLAKNLLGYRDVVANEHSGPDGRPISIDSGRTCRTSPTKSWSNCRASLRRRSQNEANEYRALE
jgi:hypothetical protein